MRVCSHCRQAIPLEAGYCPYCSQPIRRALPVHISRYGLGVGVAAGLLLIMLWSALTSSPIVTLEEYVPITPVEVTRVTVVPFGVDLSAALSYPATRTAEIDQMVQIFIPADYFWMGSNTEHLMGLSTAPRHRVYLTGYWIDQTEVTYGQYRACIESGGCPPPSHCSASMRGHYLEGAWRDRPVTCFDWYEAEDYCRWANRRLPTEAEWEKAAGSQNDERSSWPWGMATPTCELTNFAWCDLEIQPVGRYPAGASGYGVLDMAGNAAEWTADWWEEGYYASSPEYNPTGPATGVVKVIRGGSFVSYSEDIRVFARAGSEAYYSNRFTGFRCAESAGEE
jgi:formylglycine-generating enzyme required for sulfatase activity